MKNNSVKEIFEKIKSSDKILISLHKGPDGDSLGSCMAIKYLLERDFDKEVKVISKDNLASHLEGFGFLKEIEFGKSVDDLDLKKFDILIMPDWGVLSGFSKKDDLDIFTINLDHHETSSFFGDMNYINTNRPSCCSVLLDIFRGLNIKFDNKLSTYLLLGVYTDSGMFAHGNGDALRDAIFLIDNNADYNGIIDHIKYNSSLGSVKYLAKVTDNFSIVDFGRFKVGVSSISAKEINDLNLGLAETHGAPSYLQKIRGVDFLFILTETNEFIKGSFRSRKNIDVSRFAKELDVKGGGHKLAAAFRLPLMPIKKAEKKVFEAIKKVGIHKIK